MAREDDTHTTTASCDACKANRPQQRVGDSHRLLRCGACGFVGVNNVYHWHDEDVYRCFITRNWHVLGKDDLDRLAKLGVDTSALGLGDAGG